MDCFIIKTNKKSAFTLIEMMISLVLTVMVVFFIYKMMIYAHKSYNELFNISRQRTDWRYFDEIINRSAMSATNIKIQGNMIDFYYFDPNFPPATGSSTLGGYRIDRFILKQASGSSVNFSKNKDKSQNLSESDIKSANNNYVLYLDIFRSNLSVGIDSKYRGPEVVLKNIKGIYVYINTPNTDSSISVPVFNMSVVVGNNLPDDDSASKEYRFYKYAAKQLKTEWN